MYVTCVLVRLLFFCSKSFTGKWYQPYDRSPLKVSGFVATKRLSHEQMKNHGTSLRVADSMPFRTWIEVFKNLIIPGTVLDLHPHLGCKLLACSSEGIAYFGVETYPKRFSKIKDLLPNLFIQLFDDNKLKSMDSRISNMCLEVFGSAAIVDVADDVDDDDVGDLVLGSAPAVPPSGSTARRSRGSKRLHVTVPLLGDDPPLRGKRPRYSYREDGTRYAIDYSGGENPSQVHYLSDNEDSVDREEGIGDAAGHNIFQESTDDEEEHDVDTV